MVAGIGFALSFVNHRDLAIQRARAGSICETTMMLKSSDSLFKRAAPAGSAILMAAVLAACGGGPIDKSEMPPTGSGGQGGADHIAQKPGNDERLTADEWRARYGDAAKRPLTYAEWKQAEAEMAAARAKLEEEAKKTAAEQAREEEEITRAALILAEQYDNLDLNPNQDFGSEVGHQDKLRDDKLLRFVVIGLDKQTRKYEWLDDSWGGLFDNERPGWDDPSLDSDNSPIKLPREEEDSIKRLKGKFVSLNGQNVYKYFQQNCPVRVGEDEGTLQNVGGGEPRMRRVYECMAGIYVGRNSKGKMCYTFFDRDGRVSHVNDNVAVYPFNPGNSVSPYTGYSIGVSNEDLKLEQGGALHIPERRVGDVTLPAQVLPPSLPVFSRLDVGGEMFMMLNTLRRYANPVYVKQDLESQQFFRTQQAVLKFSSTAEMIEIYQKNTDNGYGTGALEDTCYVNFRSGLAGSEKVESTPSQTP